MKTVEQGDILRMEGIKHPVIVVSNNVFNLSGNAIVCPIMKDVIPGPLHIKLTNAPVEGFVACELLRYMDLSSRRFSKLSEMHYFDIMDISDAVMGMFEYQ